MANPKYVNYIPIIRINSDSAVIYEVPEQRPPRSDKQKENEKHLTRGVFNGYLSSKAKGKIKRILRTWITGGQLLSKSKSRHKLVKVPYFTFVTLTLSSKQKHSDQYIRRYLLNNFITTIERRFNVWHHLYVCEKQKNGNIHFHLLIDSYIHWRHLRDTWNKIQDQHGYIEPFQSLHGHRDPNSTDIHALQKVNNVQAYVIKYMTKDRDSLKVKGRIFGRSDALMKLNPYEEIIDSNHQNLIEHLTNHSYFEVKTEPNYTLINGPVMRYIKKYFTEIHKKILKSLHQQVFDIYKVHPSIVLTTLDKDNTKNLNYSITNNGDLIKQTFQDPEIDQVTNQYNIVCPF